MNQSSSEFLYQTLANEIGEKIKNATYRPGDRLPSTRELHNKLNLSISTVYKAYIELEKKGLIEAKPKSGYYVCCPSAIKLESADTIPNLPSGLEVSIPRIDALTPHKISVPSFVNQVVAAVKSPEYLQLGSAMIAPEFLPFRQFNKIMKDLSNRDMQSILTYNLVQGDLELRRQLSLRAVGILAKTNVHDLVITNGCTEALSLTLRAIVKDGDTIAIESPAFYGILPLLEELNLLAVEVPTDPKTGLDLEYLEQAIRQHPIKACLVTPNFHNPLGSLMPDHKKEKLVRLLNQQEIPLIEDNINSELFFEKQRPTFLKAFDRKGMVITCSSFSKTLAPGLRIGWIISGPRYLDKILKLKAGFSVSNSSLDQHILARFMAQGNYERYLRSLRARLKKQVHQYVDCIKTCFPEGTRVNLPEGGVLLWVQLPPGTDSMQVYRKALENKISILPGAIFSASGQFKNHIRIGCGFPFSQRTANGLAKLGSIINQVIN